MTDHTQKQGDAQHGSVNPVAAAVTGAVVGAAAVGVAGAAILANDDSRKRVEKGIDEAKDTVEDMKKEAQDKIAQGQEKVNEVVTAVTDSKLNVTHDTK